MALRSGGKQHFGAEKLGETERGRVRTKEGESQRKGERE